MACIEHRTKERPMSTKIVWMLTALIYAIAFALYATGYVFPPAYAMLLYAAIGCSLVAALADMKRKGAGQQKHAFEKRSLADKREPDTTDDPKTLLVTGPFSAFCACPDCSFLAVHPFSAIVEKRIKTTQLDPNDPTLVRMGPGRFGRMLEPGLVRPIEPSYEEVLTGRVKRRCAECKFEWIQQ